jgi:lysophospholipase L1-like esterase
MTQGIQADGRTRIARPGNLRLLVVSSLVALGILLVVIAVDLLRANARLRISDTATDPIHESDNHLGWRPRPNSSCTYVSKGNFEVVYTVDSEGFRVTPRPPNPALNLFLFGDSYTFGHGVNDRETYAWVMTETYLKDQVRVYNAGCNGYGIVQMYVRLLENLDRIRPGDLVVFTPTSGDIQRNLRDFVFPYSCVFRGGNSPLRVEYFPDWGNGEIRYVKLDPTLYNRLKLLVLTGHFTGGLAHAIRSWFIPDATREAAAVIEKARQETERRGARFALVFLPQIKECLKGAYKLDLSPFTFHDLRPFFPSDKAALASLRFKHDSHYNAAGHQIAAKAIVETLGSHGLLAEDYIRKPD